MLFWLTGRADFIDLKYMPSTCTRMQSWTDTKKPWNSWMCHYADFGLNMCKWRGQAVQVLHLPRKVTLELHQNIAPTTLLDTTLLDSTWLYSLLDTTLLDLTLDSTLLDSTTLLDTTLLDLTLLYLTWLYSTWLFLTLLYLTLLDSTLLDLTLLYLTLLDSTLLDLSLLYLTLLGCRSYIRSFSAKLPLTISPVTSRRSSTNIMTEAQSNIWKAFLQTVLSKKIGWMEESTWLTQRVIHHVIQNHTAVDPIYKSCVWYSRYTILIIVTHIDESKPRELDILQLNSCGYVTGNGPSLGTCMRQCHRTKTMTPHEDRAPGFFPTGTAWLIKSLAMEPIETRCSVW